MHVIRPSPRKLIKHVLLGRSPGCDMLLARGRSGPVEPQPFAVERLSPGVEVECQCKFIKTPTVPVSGCRVRTALFQLTPAGLRLEGFPYLLAYRCSIPHALLLHCTQAILPPADESGACAGLGWQISKRVGLWMWRSGETLCPRLLLPYGGSTRKMHARLVQARSRRIIPRSPTRSLTLNRHQTVSCPLAQTSHTAAWLTTHARRFGQARASSASVKIPKLRPPLQPTPQRLRAQSSYKEKHSISLPDRRQLSDSDPPMALLDRVPGDLNLYIGGYVTPLPPRPPRAPMPGRLRCDD